MEIAAKWQCLSRQKSTKISSYFGRQCDNAARAKKAASLWLIILFVHATFVPVVQTFIIIDYRSSAAFLLSKSLCLFFYRILIATIKFRSENLPLVFSNKIGIVNSAWHSLLSILQCPNRYNSSIQYAHCELVSVNIYFLPEFTACIYLSLIYNLVLFILISIRETKEPQKDKSLINRLVITYPTLVNIENVNLLSIKEYKRSNLAIKSRLILFLFILRRWRLWSQQTNVNWIAF